AIAWANRLSPTWRQGWNRQGCITTARRAGPGVTGAATAVVLRRAAAGAITVGDFGLFIQGISQLQQQFSNLLSGISGIYQNQVVLGGQAQRDGGGVVDGRVAELVRLHAPLHDD